MKAFADFPAKVTGQWKLLHCKSLKMEIFRHFPHFGGWTKGMLRRCDTFIYTEGRAML